MLLSELGTHLQTSHCEELLALRGNPEIDKPLFLKKGWIASLRSQ